MNFKCTQDGKCCKELVCYIDKEDLDRWIGEGRKDIISCLTWHLLHGRVPPEVIFIPKKQHIRHHKWLRPLWTPEWIDNNECIFLNDNKCVIYNTRPVTCKSFPMNTLNYPCPGLKDVTNTDRIKAKINIGGKRERDILIFRERKLINKMITKAKELTSYEEIKKIIISERGGDSSGGRQNKEETGQDQS